MIKYITVLGACAVLTSCGSTGGSGGAASGGKTAPESWKAVTDVTTTVTGKREVMKVTVGEKDVVAMLTWRDYSKKLDV